MAFDYDGLIAELEGLGDKKLIEFSKKIIPGANVEYGLRTPDLRAIAKRICAGDWRDYLSKARTGSHEERTLMAMVIAKARCGFDEKLGLIRGFVPLIDNWAVCDVFAADLKEVRKHLEETRALIGEYLRSKEEFVLRFAAVMLMDYYINDEYIDDTIKELIGIWHEGYYVKMAVAWAMSVCFVKYREKALAVISSGALDDFTHNRTISKICDSYRVSNEDKSMLKKMRRA